MKKVLMVYDDRQPSQDHSRSLYYNGIIPMVTNSASDAGNLCSFGKFDLVVIDLLDEEERIKEAIQAVIAHDVKIMVITSNANSSFEQRLLAYGADSVIVRPDKSGNFVSQITENSQDLAYYHSSYPGS